MSRRRIGQVFAAPGARRPAARGESGIMMVETIVAIAVLGIVAVVFLSGLATTSKAAIVADEQATAENLARSQMEYAKNLTYVYEASAYTPAPLPAGDGYVGYSVTISAEPLNAPDDGIQRLTVVVQRSGRELHRLEGYKVDR